MFGDNILIIPDAEVLMRATAFDLIEEIADELFTIEESARLSLGIVTYGDQLLHELNFPHVADLVHLPAQSVWAYPEFQAK